MLYVLHNTIRSVKLKIIVIQGHPDLSPERVRLLLVLNPPPKRDSEFVHEFRSWGDAVRVKGLEHSFVLLILII